MFEGLLGQDESSPALKKMEGRRRKKEEEQVDKCNYKSISRKHFNNHIDTKHSGNTFLCT